MSTTIEKALHSADALLKGGTSPLRAAEYEQAMMDHADRQREAGESSAAAFARLVKQRDPTVERLWAACDLARTYEHHGAVLAKQRATAATPSGVAAGIAATAAENLDTYVALNKRASESTEAAYARLAVEDARFASLYSMLDQCRRLAAG